MFTFFKEKIKNVISTFTDKVVEQGEDVPVSEQKKEEVTQEVVQEKQREKKTEKKKESKTIVEQIREKISTKKISAEQFDELFWNIEVELLENNVAFEVIEKIKDDLKKKLVDAPLKRGEIEATVRESLRKSVEDVLDFLSLDLASPIKQKKQKPYVICFFGVNGGGKTTSIAKVAHYVKQNGFTCVLAAADTYRAAAVEQLQIHGEKLGLKVIQQGYGADPAAVCFDARRHCEKHKVDVLLIDTSGRLHSNIDLMKEMEKIVRVAKPDMKVFVSESISGNDVVEQAINFDKHIGIDAIILTKSDVDEKGGTIISVSYVTKKPILFLGTGQEYEDLEIPTKEGILRSIGL